MGKVYKLKENREFLKIYRKGRYAVSNSLTVYVKTNFFKINRIGITASSKYGNAVRRNRVRRLIYESWRLLENQLITGYDFVIVARKTNNTDKPTLWQIHKEMLYLMKKLNVLNRN